MFGCLVWKVLIVNDETASMQGLTTTVHLWTTASARGRHKNAHTHTDRRELLINTCILNCSRNYLYFSAFLVSTGCAALVAPLNATPHITVAFLLRYVSAAVRCLGFSVAVGFGLGLRLVAVHPCARYAYSHFCHSWLDARFGKGWSICHRLGLFAAC